MTRNNVMTWVIAAGSLPLVACGPASTEEAGGDAGADLAKIAIDNTEKALLGAHSAGSFIADSPTFAETMSSLGGTEVCTTSCDTSGICTETCTEEPVTPADLQESREELRQGIDDFITQLREEIFTAQTLEQTGPNFATYRFGVEELCSEITEVEPAEPGAPAPAPSEQPMYDAECVDYANRLAPRLHLTSAGPGNVDMALQLTASRRTVGRFELYQGHVNVSVDLGEVKATLDSIGEDLGTLADLDGTLAFEIRENAALDYSFLFSVDDDLRLAIADEETGDRMQIGLGKSQPTTELRLNGIDQNITGTLDYGAVTVSGPLNAFRDSFSEVEYDPVTGEELPRPTYTGTIEGLIAGYEGSITFDGNTDHLIISGIGMGNASSTLKFDGQVISQFDLNPDHERHFDLAYQKSATGALLTFSPTLDVRVLLNFMPLQAQIPDLATSLLNDNIRVWFDGENPSIETSENQLKVVSGTLNVTSTATPDANITVAPGMCLVDSGVTEPTNEAIGAMMAGACQ
jgi:hypothetical protein